MTPREELETLAAKVEAAEGADRELDALIAPHQGLEVVDEGHPVGRMCYDDIGAAHLLPRYGTSLDAAMSLIGEGAFWRLGNDGEGPDVAAFKATVTSGDGPTLAFHDAVAATPALALTAAALRARASALTGYGEKG